MKKIKVIQLVEDLSVGGLEKVVFEIARFIDKERFDIEVWCVARGGPISEEIKKDGILVSVLDIHTYHNPANVLKMVRLLKKARPDIVHSHGYYAAVIGRIASRFARVPAVIAHVHNTYWNYAARNLFMEFSLSYITDKIVCCSNAVRDFVLQYEKVSPKKVITVYNSIDIERFRRPVEKTRLKRSLGIAEDETVVISVASLTPKKGHRYLLEALGAIDAKHKVRLLVVGTGPLRAELENYVHRKQLGAKVIFLGVRDDIPGLLGISDIFAMPSLIEGFGIATAEAMAAGLPVLATNVGGTPEVVSDGVSGILVPSKDPVALAEAITSLILDKETAERMGREGYKIAKERFSVETMVSKIEKLYEALLEGKKRA